MYNPQGCPELYQLTRLIHIHIPANPPAKPRKAGWAGALTCFVAGEAGLELQLPQFMQLAWWPRASSLLPPFPLPASLTLQRLLASRSALVAPQGRSSAGQGSARASQEGVCCSLLAQDGQLALCLQTPFHRSPILTGAES